ncbi:hypothetical protein [Bacillus altitudinis]|uniref:hypothetical protein n=1 Tax=Bacillus altitudinis TaxID=293387 RepID=UPI001980653D|nr:hypothetical protein [Bacillus altitudinis]QSI43418.1 hypothetical protein I4W80_12975 [Bacillus altitudinis]
MKKLSVFGVIIILPMFINLLFTFKLPFVQGSMDNWFSFFGSYSGAIVGGIVAYFISKLQWQNHKKSEEENRKINELFGLICVKRELKKIHQSIEILERVKKNFLEKYKNFTHEDFYIQSYNLENLDLDNWDNINFSDSDLVEKLLKIQEFYIDFREALSLDFKKIKAEIYEVKHKLYRANLNNKTDEYIMLNKILSELEYKNQEGKDLKFSAWEKLRNENMKKEISNAITTVENKISHINNLKRTREKG